MYLLLLQDLMTGYLTLSASRASSYAPGCRAAGRWLRAQPAARLALLAYVAVMHLLVLSCQLRGHGRVATALSAP